MSLIWSALIDAIAFFVFNSWKTSLVMGALVLSHWVLDFISHAADLPRFFNGSPPVGLGLENAILVGIIMEFPMLFAGVAIYLLFKKRNIEVS